MNRLGLLSVLTSPPRRRWLWLSGLLMALFSAQAHAQSCTPRGHQAAFYTDADYKGRCVVRAVGDYPSAAAIGLPNDSISSIKLGRGAQVVVCKDSNFAGDCVLVKTSTRLLNDAQVGNDAVSSAKVQVAGAVACAPGNGQASFYTNANYLGACVVRSLGAYPNAQAVGLPNYSISSVRLGAGVQVLLCKDAGFQGDCIVQTTSTPFLDGDRVGNDAVTSLKVQAAGTTECTPGAGQAAFFVNADYVAPCTVRGTGTYANAESIGLPNDSISSVRVGAGAQVVVCNDTGFKGDCIVLTSSTPLLNGDRVGNDAVTSAKVQPAGTQECLPPDGQVGLYMHAGFLAPCVVKPQGNYADATAIGLDDKSLSSIRVGKGAQACVCSGEGFTTQCQPYSVDTPWLGDSHFDNLTSSVRVQKAGATCNTDTSTSTTQGYGSFSVNNCHSERRTVHLWIRDRTAGTPYVDKGELAAQWDASGACPAGAPPTVIPLADGHLVDFVAVDPAASACGGQNDPSNGGCQRNYFSAPLPGKTGGPAVPIRVD